jgi:hypothetical protein
MMSLAAQHSEQVGILDPKSFLDSEMMGPISPEEVDVLAPKKSQEEEVIHYLHATGDHHHQHQVISQCSNELQQADSSLLKSNGFSRSKSLYSFGGGGGSTSLMDEDDSCSNTTGSLISAVEPSSFSTFGMDLRKLTGESPNIPAFDRGCREAMEPHLRKARLERERSRISRKQNVANIHDSIASSVGVPYTKLRSERPFLFDVDSYPMHDALAKCLGVADLSKIHEQEADLQDIMSPLLSRSGRKQFQEAYDGFVTSFCVPLLHSMAMSNGIFHNSQVGPASTSKITYRYQAFPSIRVVRPGDTSPGLQCDSTRGHSIGYLRFHVPLTPTFGTNALYTESHPGREDWHPLLAKSFGLGFLFDGARCLHFNMENTTDATSVALDFCIAIYREGDAPIQHVDGHGLCNQEILEDALSQDGPGFYDEAVIDMNLARHSWQQLVAKKYGNHLLDPDYRAGFPFL